MRRALATHDAPMGHGSPPGTFSEEKRDGGFIVLSLNGQKIKSTDRIIHIDKKVM